jgi:hypothetical protein
MSDFDDELRKLRADRDRLLVAFERYYEDLKALSVEYRALQRDFLVRWKKLSRRASRVARDSDIAAALDAQPLSADNIPTPLDPEEMEQEADARRVCLENVDEVYEILLEDLKEEYSQFE